MTTKHVMVLLREALLNLDQEDPGRYPALALQKFRDRVDEICDRVEHDDYDDRLSGRGPR